MSYRGTPRFQQEELTSVRRARESQEAKAVDTRTRRRLRESEGGPGSGPRKGSGGEEKSPDKPFHGTKIDKANRDKLLRRGFKHTESYENSDGGVSHVFEHSDGRGARIDTGSSYVGDYHKWGGKEKESLEGGPGSGPRPGQGRAGRLGKPDKGGGKGVGTHTRKSIDLYSAFGEESPAMDSMASQMRNLHKMKGANDIATTDKQISIVVDNPRAAGPETRTFKFNSPNGFTKAKLLKAAILSTRKAGGSAGHYMSDLVVEGIRRTRSGKYLLDIGT